MKSAIRGLSMISGRCLREDLVEILVLKRPSMILQVLMKRSCGDPGVGFRESSLHDVVQLA